MSANDVVQRALDEISARVTVTDYLTETTPAAKAAQRWYAVCRQRLLRAAPWGFARKTALLDQLALSTDTPNLVPYPWLVKYAYPTDCLKVRYILPPPVPPTTDEDVPDVSSTLATPWCAPSRQWRFLPSFDPAEGEDPAVRTLLANVPGAYGVYTADVEDTDLWDQLFMQAMETYLGSKLLMTLTGNVGMRQGFEALVKDAVTQARAVDGNEAIPTTDHVVDWTAARNSSGWVAGNSVGGVGWGGPGQWYDGYDLNWGM
jgi:hypothetical protein